jgi:SDR family mycofactocin-dependent oxidoreductase
MGALDGKVALVTGAARGQGRSHAVRLAEEGADIVAVDICAQVENVLVPGATPEDLEETARQVEALGRRIFAAQADIRDLDRMTEVVEGAVAELGRLDIVIANAAIWAVGEDEPRSSAGRLKVWKETIDVNLTGQWVTLEATVPTLLKQDEGGAIVLIGSAAGLGSMSMGSLAQTAYAASKHGLLGLMRNYAVELGPHSIRVNIVAPFSAATPMTMNPVAEEYFGNRPELAELGSTPLPVSVVEPLDISNAVLYLASDAGRYVTGIALPVDSGFLVK